MPTLRLSNITDRQHGGWSGTRGTDTDGYEPHDVRAELRSNRSLCSTLGLTSGAHRLIAIYGSDEYAFFNVEVDGAGVVEQVSYSSPNEVMPADVEHSAREDMWEILDQTPAEVDGLRAAVAAGKIDGSVYQGECACLVGTIAKVRGVPHTTLGVKPNAYRPAEKWFGEIRPGDVPRTIELDGETTGEKHARLALRWIDEWTASRRKLVAALAPKPEPATVDVAF